MMWWRVGLVRVLALVILAVGLDGLAEAIHRHTFWDISKMSAPTAGSLILIAVALFVLGFRTEREHVEIHDSDA